MPLPQANSQEGVSFGRVDSELAGVMQTLMDTERIIQEIDLTLRGYSLDITKTTPDGLPTWQKTTEEYIDEDLRVKLINLIRSHLNVITLYSNINEEIIKKICVDLHIAISELLFKNPEKIRSNNRVDTDVWQRAHAIVLLVMDAVWIGLYQAYEHGQRSVIEKIGGFTEIKQVKPEEKRKKLLGLF